MAADSAVDTAFDVRTDSRGRDPDSHSATLRRYHRLLWSKPLPDGSAFELDDRLHHVSALGEFWLSSDSITHTYSGWLRPARLVAIVAEVPADDVAAFYALGCTVGAFIVFPLKTQVGGRRIQSINQRRGTHPRIRDRFDLTLECIRRHYVGDDSPLREVLEANADFFGLFGGFRGYVQHFLLQDFVTDDFTSVRPLKPFDNFSGDPLPANSMAEYRTYMSRSMSLVHARNTRLDSYAKQLGLT